jgi:hypothetical protein
MSASLILLIIAAVMFFVASLPLPWASPVQLGWLGAFFATLSFFVGR